MRPSLLRWAPATAFVLILGTLFAPSASAEDGWQTAVSEDNNRPGTAYCVESDYKRAAACFHKDGDWLHPLDLKADGRRVAVKWKTGDGRSGVCVHDNGHRDGEQLHTFFATPFWGCNKKFADKVEVVIRAGYCDGSQVSCTQLSHWQFGPSLKVFNDGVN